MGSRTDTIVLSRASHNSASPREVVSAVKRYAYALHKRSVHDSKMPTKVSQCRCVEYYCDEVLNGNIGQFVLNCRWDPHVVAFVAAGLAEMGVNSQAELFGEVVRFVDQTRSDLEVVLSMNLTDDPTGTVVEGKRVQIIPKVLMGKNSDAFDHFMRTQGYGDTQHDRYRERLDAIRGNFFKAFTDHPGGYEAGCEQIRAANAEWIKSWNGLKLVDDNQFDDELDNLLAPKTTSYWKWLLPRR
jgi:hypothetical protein